MPPGACPGSMCYGPGINTAAVLLAGYGNVPAERTAHLIGMRVSAGFVDKAASRLDVRLQDAGFDDAMRAALAAEQALGGTIGGGRGMAGDQPAARQPGDPRPVVRPGRVGQPHAST